MDNLWTREDARFNDFLCSLGREGLCIVTYGRVLPLWDIRDYWLGKILIPEGTTAPYCHDYLERGIHALSRLEDLETSEEWKDLGYYLADATARIYQNGTHDFISEAVPALVEHVLKRKKAGFKPGVDLLSIHINRNYRKGGIFSEVAKKMRLRQITSVGDIKTHYPGQGIA